MLLMETKFTQVGAGFLCLGVFTVAHTQAQATDKLFTYQQIANKYQRMSRRKATKQGQIGYADAPKPIREWSDRLADGLANNLMLDDDLRDVFKRDVFDVARQMALIVIDESYVEAFVPLAKKRDKMTLEDGLRVCELYSHIGVKQRACQIVGYHAITFDELREREPELNSAWAEAETAFGERVYHEVVRRAIDGVPEPKFNMKTGQIIGYVNKKSDRMLELLAKGKFPSVFRDNFHTEQKAKAETANIDFNSLSTEARLTVREKIKEIRELIAADMARNVTPEMEALDAPETAADTA